jgi:hypothetical protein
VSSVIFYPGILRTVIGPLDDAPIPVSTVFVTGWNVAQRISPQKATTFKIKGYGISSTIQITFDTLQREHAHGWVITHGICTPIVWPIDKRNFVPSSAFNVDVRISTSKNFKFKINQRRSAKVKIHFDVYNYLFAHAVIEFNDRLRVYKPGVTVGSWKNQVDEPVVKPISYSNFTVSPFFQWNYETRIKIKSTMRFNTHGKRSARMVSAFHDYGTKVVCQKSVLWNTRERI